MKLNGSALIYACLVLLFVPFAAVAESAAIEGGFGIKLGDKIDINTLERKPGGDSDRGEYLFTPENPYEALTEYSVFVSPQGTAYQIQAIGVFRNGDACRAELARLEQALTEKYGSPVDDRRAKITGISRVSFGDDSRRVVASCDGFFKYKLKLTYSDKSLEEMAEKGEERQAIPETRDTSGL